MPSLSPTKSVSWPKNNHHPDIYLTWGKVKITLWTHKIDGLTESDFVLAAKIEEAKIAR
jgi:pterin-4a-carbinolamine dehydratase